MGHKHSKEKLDGEDIKRQAELQVLLALQLFKYDKWGNTPVDKMLSDIHETLPKLSDKVKKAGKTKAIPWADTANLAVFEAQYAFITKHQGVGIRVGIRNGGCKSWLQVCARTPR